MKVKNDHRSKFSTLLLKIDNELLITSQNYAHRNLGTEFKELSTIKYICPKLFLDSCKRPPLLSDHESFPIWVFAYKRSDCTLYKVMFLD